MTGLLKLLALFGFVAALASIACSQTAQRDTSSSSSNFVREVAHDRRPTTFDAWKNFSVFETEYGWIVTNDTAWMRKVVTALRTAATRFEAVFGKPVGRRGLILDRAAGHDAAIVSGAGWSWKWTWSDSSFSTDVHELGHEWFGQSYSWRQQTESYQYGTSAADWLDETAAILLEDSVRTEMRRSWLLTVYRSPQSHGKAAIQPLDTFFTMEHPIGRAAFSVMRFNMREKLRKQQGGRTGEVMRDSLGNEITLANLVEALQSRAPQAGAFYAQCRGLIDFLTERTNDPTIFGAIAANEARGSNVTEWLRANGTRYGLPTTVDGLEREWQGWLAQLSER